MDDIKKLFGDAELSYTSLISKLDGSVLALVPKGQKVFLHKESETPIITNNGEWIPKQKMDDLNEMLKAEKLLTANTIKELDTLKTSAGDSVKLQETIDKMKVDTEKAKTDNDLRFENLNKSALVLEGLLEKGAKRSNAKLMATEISLDKVVMADGKITNADELFKTVLVDHKSLFGKPILKGNDPIIPDGAPEGYITYDKFMAMTTTERATNITKINQSSPHWDRNKN